MNTLKIIILTVATLVTLAIIVMVIQVLLRRAKNKISEDEKIKLSFGIWFMTLFLSGSLITAKAISVFAEVIDNIYKTNPAKAILESFKTGSLFIGLSIVWLLLWYFIVNTLSVLILGKRNETIEVDIDNYTFFLVRGIMLIGFTICLLPVFEIILRAFIPSVNIPFYH